MKCPICHQKMRFNRKVKSSRPKYFRRRYQSLLMCKKCHLLHHYHDDNHVFFYIVNNRSIDYYSDINESHLRSSVQFEYDWIYDGLIDSQEVEYISKREKKLRVFI
jgi:hypothetical protein